MRKINGDKECGLINIIHMYFSVVVFFFLGNSHKLNDSSRKADIHSEGSSHTSNEFASPTWDQYTYTYAETEREGKCLHVMVTSLWRSLCGDTACVIMQFEVCLVLCFDCWRKAACHSCMLLSGLDYLTLIFK